MNKNGVFLTDEIVTALAINHSSTFLERDMAKELILARKVIKAALVVVNDCGLGQWPDGMGNLMDAIDEYEEFDDN